MSKLFLLEDDFSLIQGLSFAFSRAGYELDIARTVKEAESLWQDGDYDLLILDVSLPDGSGFSFCEAVRQVSQVPILFLTASDEETSIIMGLDMGGDTISPSPSSWRFSCPGSMPCFAEAGISGSRPGNWPPAASRCICWRGGQPGTGCP